MKRIKKLASFLLAMVMVLAMGTTVFAGGEVTDPQPGSSEEPEAPAITHEYEIYQIFTGEYSQQTLSNIKWGANGTGTAGEEVEKNILDEITGTTDLTDPEKLAVIQKYANLEGTPVRSGSGTRYEGLDAGYYLIKDKDDSLDQDENAAYTLYVVQVVNGVLEFAPKSGVPETSKKIVEGENKVDANQTAIGKKVEYEITGTLPQNYDVYKSYYYEFIDSLSSGLTFNNDVKVYLNTVEEANDITTSFTVTSSGNTQISIKCEDIKKLDTVTKDSTIIVRYSATLNRNAVIASTGNPNEVKLVYSNNPNKNSDGTQDDSTGETPEDKVVTYTTEIEILKTDENNEVLEGAEFTLTGDGIEIVLVSGTRFVAAADGTFYKLTNGSYTEKQPTEGGDNANYESTTVRYNKETFLEEQGVGQTSTTVSGFVDANGKVKFTGLSAGHYKLSETTTPAGFNTIKDIEFEITCDLKTGNPIYGVSCDSATITVNNNTLSTTIVNKSGSLLPSTGGIGTTIFYVIGGILVVAAGVLLVTKKRMKAE